MREVLRWQNPACYLARSHPFSEMRSRLKFVITAIVLCHLFRGVPLVISQARPEAAPAQEPPTISAQSAGKIQISATAGEPLTIKADQLEEQGNVATLRGNVEAHFRDYILHAD